MCSGWGDGGEYAVLGGVLMLTELISIPIRNGILRETYSLERDEDGDIFLRNVLDAADGEPHDMMHIDPAAYGPLSLAFAALERLRVVALPRAVVLQFPVRRRLVDVLGPVG